MDKKIKWKCYSFIGDSNQIEFFDVANNAYVKKNLLDDSFVIESFLGLNSEADRRFSSIAKYNNKVIFAPGTENILLIYDEIEKTSEKLCLDENRVCSSENNYKYCKILVWDEKAYLFPHSAVAIVSVDLKTNDIEYLEDWYVEAGVEKGKWAFCEFGYQVQEVCYLPFSYQNKILCFNLKTAEFNIYEVPGCTGGFSCMNYDGKDIWLASLFQPYVYRWNLEHEIAEKFILNPTEYTTKGYSNLFIVGDYILLCSMRGKEIWFWNKRNKVMERKIDLPTQNNVYEKQKYFSYIAHMDDNCLLGYSLETETLMKIDIDTGELFEYNTNYSEDDRFEVINRIFREKNIEGILVENNLLELDFLIKKISGADKMERNNTESQATVKGMKFLLV